MSYLIARMLVKIKFISLVNLILEREVVRELIQKDCNSEQIVNELNLIQNDSRKREKMLNDYDQLIQLLGQNGSSKRVAEKIWFEFGSGN